MLDKPAIMAKTMREYAASNDVCVRPVLRQVTDTVTGEAQQVALPCGSTREHRCPACAAKSRRLRMQQCREGWHLAQDPLEDDTAPESAAPTTAGSSGGDACRRVRSTRRRRGVPALPRIPAEQRSVGRTFTSPQGRQYRPSMFVTLTVPSFGHVVPGRGYPVQPGRYDYRLAALYALVFPRLFDRWMQNLRRCAGFKVQYFGAIEAQRRLAPHIHLAIRGAIPRHVLGAVTAATYLHLWWPAFDQVVHEDAGDGTGLPVWDQCDGCFRDPDTRAPLPVWEQALDVLQEPAATLHFGRQMDVQGIIAEQEDADVRVRYLTKYLTKSIAHTFTDPDNPGAVDPAYETHIDRLHREVRWLPCAPECANWLRYGVQPRDPRPGLRPGFCPSPAHDRANLGLGGRRVQVSRHWSGKTLAEHRADRASVVRQVLAEAGIEAPEVDRLAAAQRAHDGQPRFSWDPVPDTGIAYVHVIARLVCEQRRWRREYDAAKQRLQHRSDGRARASPPVDNYSATPAPTTTIESSTPPRPPDNQPAPGPRPGGQG